MEYTIFGRTNAKVSKLGLGGAPLAGDFGDTDEREIERMIHCALDLGVNFIDTAPLYGRGQSEKRIGKALQSGKREKVFLSSKAARSDLAYTYATTIQSVEDSLIRLSTDWIDLLHIHDVETQPLSLIMEETLPALERLRDEGKIRFIAASSHNLSLLSSLMETGRFDSIQFYGRYMLMDYTAKEETIPLARSMNIGVVNGSVLGMGLLADQPAKFLNSDQVEKAKARMEKLAFLRHGSEGGLIEAAMRFSLGNPDIHVTLTGTATVQTLLQNASYCDGAALPEEQLQRIYELFPGMKFAE